MKSENIKGVELLLQVLLLMDRAGITSQKQAICFLAAGHSPGIKIAPLAALTDSGENNVSGFIGCLIRKDLVYKRKFIDDKDFQPKDHVYLTKKGKAFFKQLPSEL